MRSTLPSVPVRDPASGELLGVDVGLTARPTKQCMPPAFCSDA